MSAHYRSAIILLLLLALLPGATPAGRAANTIEQSGTPREVLGTVWLPGGTTPAAGAHVWITPLRGDDEPDPTGWRQDTTKADGSFYFSPTVPGKYWVEVHPPDNQPTANLYEGSFQVLDYDFTSAPEILNVTLPEAKKRIIGSVQLNGNGLGGVFVYATAPGRTGRATRTASDGSFGLGLHPGTWQVYVGNIPGALWQFVDQRSYVDFADNTDIDERTLNFTVQPTVATIRGRVLTPDGQPLPLPPGTSYTPYVYAYGDKSDLGRAAYLDATGAFTMPVVADSYTLVVVIEQDLHPLHGPPPSHRVTVTAGEKDIGTLFYEALDSGIKGQVRDSAGAPIANVEVEVWRENGSVRTTRTNASGYYSFQLPAATWDIAVSPHPSHGFLEEGSLKQVTTKSGEIQTLDFELTRAANTLFGSFVEASAPTTPLTDVRGWAYARDPASDEYVAWDYVEGGSFILNVPAGTLRVGVLLAPGSRYSFAGEEELTSQQNLVAPDELDPAALDALELAPFEQEVHVTPAAPGEPAAMQTVRLTLHANNATISGRVLDQAGNPVTGVPVVVSLTPERAADAWQWVDVDPNTGSFSISVGAGTWYLSAFVDDENAPYNAPYTEYEVTVAAGATATQDITLQKLDGVVQGVVQDEAGNPLAGQLVWVSNPYFTASAETGNDGRYKIAVPLQNPDGSTASYQLGGDFACESLTECFLDSETITIVPTPLLRAGPPTLNQSVSGNITAEKANGGAILSGRLIKDGKAYSNQTVKGGQIYGVTINKDETDRDGVFEVLLTWRGNGPSEFNGKLRAGSADIQVKGIRRPNLVAGPPQPWQTVELPPIELDPTEGLPSGIIAQFNNANGWSATLKDGTRIEIAPDSVPLRSTESSAVRVMVSPTINIYPTGQFAEATWYGYEISLTAVSSNRPIDADLLKPARLVLRYGGQDYALNNIRESQLRPARLADGYWHAAPAFVLDRGANKVTVQTKTLGTWALVQERSACAGCVYLPVVQR